MPTSRTRYRSFTLSLSLVSTASLVAMIVSGCSPETTEGGAEAKKRSVPVKTVAVVQEDIKQTTTQPATVRSFFRAEIRAKASGYIKAIKADIGDFVESGATLAVISVPEMAKQRQIIKARIRRYQSEEKRAEAGIVLARANIRSAEAKLAQSKSEIGGAKASLAAMEAEFRRTDSLVQGKSIASAMLDEVREKRDSEIARNEAMTSAIHAAEAQVAVAEAKTTSAQADLQAAQAETSIARRQLEELDELLAYATLKAPFSGIVTHRSAELGDLVREGSEVGKGKPMFVISQVDKVRIHIPVPEADAALVSRGDSVSLTFPSFPAEQPITASVTRLSGDLDPSTRTMLVEVQIPNPDGKLIPGMFGQATISLSTKTAANMLPARAVRFSETGEAYVYIVGEDQIVTVAPITTGIDNGHSIEVKTGVEPGQQVIDAHLKRFTTGQKVTLIGQ